jgi:transposase-like protein
VYPILYIDAIRIKIRDGGVVANKAAHVVIGVDIQGIKKVLGIWIQQTEARSSGTGYSPSCATAGVATRCSCAVTG